MGFLVVNLIWGAASPIIKYTLGFIPPFTFLFLRLLIACILMLPYVIVKLTEEKINKKDYFNFFLLGLFAQSSLAITFVALEYTSALDATVISVITGALIIYAGHYFYKEKVNKLINIGLVLTLVGTLIVVVEPLLTGVSNHIPVYERIIGNVLAFIYNLTWVVYVIWSKMCSSKEKPKLLKKTLSFIHIKPMTKTYSPTLTVAITFYVGLLTLIPLALLENFGSPGTTNFTILTIDFRGILGLLYMAIFSSIVAFSLNQWALENGRVSDSAIFGYLGPVFAFPIAFLLLGEVPTFFLILGIIVIASGVIIAEAGAQKANGMLNDGNNK
jgi:drug/metabolite transporter (DMT)-like permease